MQSIRVSASVATAAIAMTALIAAFVFVSSASTASATGNGAPSGSHYQLNIIGVSKDKNPNMTGGDGRRIFVGLGRTGEVSGTRINLTEGDFGVVDANGTDGVAAFSLPNPDPDGDGTTAYSVYVRALGKPGGKATMQSCYTDAQTGETWCAVDYVGGVNPITIERTKGKQTFTNVSKDLLYVDTCTSYDVTTQTCNAWDQLPLFSDSNDSYFWQYDNQGLKVAQLRFYEVPTVTGW
jgi:hypothetical protein